MKKKIAIGIMATVGLLLAACASAPAPQPSAQMDKYGDGVQLELRTPIADILTQPDTYAGLELAVEGTIVGVCQMQGCWIELADEQDRRLRLKVEDGVIVFPEEVSGRRAIAQGTLDKQELTRDQYAARLRHEAEELGQEFDESSLPEPPYQVLQLMGSGALIEPAS